MIDASERCLQLPVFVFAQKSINTLISGVKPLKSKSEKSDFRL